jgi:two-component system sporulation sensor kinase A
VVKIDNDKNKFTIFFIVLKSIMFLIIGLNSISLFKIIIYLILFLVLCFLILSILENGKELMEIRLTFKELEKEKQIRTSLFKITHEIKNPIAVCKAYLDMLDVDNCEQTKKYIPIIRGEIERLLGLLQDYLLINKNNMNLDIMDINVLLDDVINNVSGLMSSNNINFNIDTVDDELFINGDYNRLSQVLINIIKNSVESDPTSIKVNVKESNDELIINIEDNGTGIPEDVLEKIYEPFYTTKKCGTGLGVSLSNEIITAHKGTLEYTSKVGIGTNVKITLPSYNEL